MGSRFSWTHPADRHDIDKDIYIIGCGCDHFDTIDVKRFRNNNHKIDFHILYFVQGGATVYINQKVQKASAGDFVFFYYDDDCKYTYHHNPETIVYWMHFSGQRSPELVSDLGFTESFITHSEHNLSKHFENIIDEIVIKRKHYNKAMNAHLYLLLTAIVRKKQFNDKKLDKIISMMSNTNNNNKTLDDYANICHLSKSQFIRSFKSYTGKTPMKYRNDIIIENAKLQLTRSNLSITEISQTLGFENIYYFSTMFKKATGVSPAEYRKQN